MTNKKLFLHSEVQIEQVLTEIQQYRVVNKKSNLSVKLLTVDYDWAVVLAWLMDNHVLKVNKRIPFKRFLNWLNSHHNWKYLPENEKSIARAFQIYESEPQHSQLNQLLYETISKLYDETPTAV